MKYYYIIALVIVSALLGACSNKSTEQKEMEKALGYYTKGKYEIQSFSLDSTITLADEVANRLYCFESRLFTDKEWGEVFGDNSNYIKDSTMVSYLKTIERDYPKLWDKPTFREYSLLYKSGNVISKVRGRFTIDGVLVQLDFDGQPPMVFGNVFTIPEYYEYLNR